MTRLETDTPFKQSFRSQMAQSRTPKSFNLMPTHANHSTSRPMQRTHSSSSRLHRKKFSLRVSLFGPSPWLFRASGREFLFLNFSHDRISLTSYLQASSFIFFIFFACSCYSTYLGIGPSSRSRCNIQKNPTLSLSYVCLLRKLCFVDVGPYRNIPSRRFTHRYRTFQAKRPLELGPVPRTDAVPDRQISEIPLDSPACTTDVKLG